MSESAYLAWQQETTRLMPEIMRDAVAHALYRLAEQVWNEMNEKIGTLTERAERAERRAIELEGICLKMRERASEAEEAYREAVMDSDY